MQTNVAARLRGSSSCRRCAQSRALRVRTLPYDAQPGRACAAAMHGRGLSARAASVRRYSTFTISRLHAAPMVEQAPCNSSNEWYTTRQGGGGKPGR